jgi:hypothetical protein
MEIIKLTLTNEGREEIQFLSPEKVADFRGLVEENLDRFDNFDFVKNWNYDGFDVIVEVK